MYRQEYRFSPATPAFRRFDVWYDTYIPFPFPAFPCLLEYPQSRHRNSRCRFAVSVSRPFSHAHGLRFYPQMRLGLRGGSSSMRVYFLVTAISLATLVASVSASLTSAVKASISCFSCSCPASYPSDSL